MCQLETLGRVIFGCCLAVCIYYAIWSGMIAKPDVPHSKWKKVLSKSKNIGSDEFNKYFWLTTPSFNKKYARYDDYGIFLRICPYCATPYKKIWYKRLTYKPSVDLLRLIKSNWSNTVPYNVYGKDYLLYSTHSDLKNNINEWESCHLNNNINYNDNNKLNMGFPGLCYKSEDTKKDGQYMVYDEPKKTLIERPASKIFVLSYVFLY